MTSLCIKGLRNVMYLAMDVIFDYIVVGGRTANIFRTHA